MRTDLLWVYEGLTQYYGVVLTARSGLWTPEQFRESLAIACASLDHRPGRTWRSLQDTADAAQVLYTSSSAWGSWRRGADFYDEGTLIWLEADALMRQQSQGKASLDDFCRLFHGGPPGVPGGGGAAPTINPYTFDDVVNALTQVLAYDWRSFLLARLTSTDPHAPLGGIAAGGWRVAYTELPNDFARNFLSDQKGPDFSFSLGLRIKDDGSIADAIPGLPAYQAGAGPGMKLIAVGGRKFSGDILRDALRAGKFIKEQPLELLVENAEFYSTLKLDYHAGERYPHLERDGSKPDVLSEIIKPRTAP
jgi:predicted metalloprotease with PDZ domain